MISGRGASKASYQTLKIIWQKKPFTFICFNCVFGALPIMESNEEIHLEYKFSSCQTHHWCFTLSDGSNTKQSDNMYFIAYNLTKKWKSMLLYGTIRTFISDRKMVNSSPAVTFCKLSVIKDLSDKMYVIDIFSVCNKFILHLPKAPSDTDYSRLSPATFRGAQAAYVSERIFITEERHCTQTLDLAWPTDTRAKATPLLQWQETMPEH